MRDLALGHVKSLHFRAVDVKNGAVINEVSDLEGVKTVEDFLSDFEFCLEVVCQELRIVVGWLGYFRSNRCSDC